jgi:transcriptional regulator with PAS, ATPase and Fis domain
MKNLILVAHKDNYYAAAALLYDAVGGADVEFASGNEVHIVLAGLEHSEYENIYICGIMMKKESADEIKAAIEKLTAAGKTVKWYALSRRVEINVRLEKFFKKYLFACPDGKLMQLICANEKAQNETFKRLLPLYDELDGIKKGLEDDSPASPEAEYVKYRMGEYFELREKDKLNELASVVRELALDKIPKSGIAEAKAYCKNHVRLVYKCEKMGLLVRDIIHIGQKAMGTPVLITGETGSGKDVIARKLHQVSGREAFTAINCAALPVNLIEASLFGYVKGAFTGAEKDTIGYMEAASGGTIFLDEIGEMAFELQGKLLRVLETGKFYKLGEHTKESRSDAWVITATNKNLKKLVDQGKFREDLYYRLNVVNVHVPPLRERREDIKDLVATYMANCDSTKKRRRTVYDSELKMLESYDWPGNVRQLYGFLERVMILENKERNFRSLFDDMKKEDNFVPGLASEIGDEVFDLEEIEKQTIIRALKKFGNNLTKTREALGIVSPNTLRDKMKEYNISIK